MNNGNTHLVSLFTQLESLDTIINVTSGLAFVQLTKTPVYCGTKAFFHSYTLTIRHLLKAKNIEVIEMIPPALNTDLGGKGIHDGQFWQYLSASILLSISLLIVGLDCYNQKVTLF